MINSAEENSVVLEPWASEIMDILQCNSNLRMEIANKMTDRAITEEELRSLLTPAASDALKKQFDVAHKTPAAY